MASTRDQIIETMSQLHGGAGLPRYWFESGIVKESGAPKGSGTIFRRAERRELSSGGHRAGRERCCGRGIEDTRSRFLRAMPTRTRPSEIRHARRSRVRWTGFSAAGLKRLGKVDGDGRQRAIDLGCLQAYERLQGAFGEKLIACGYSESRSQELAIYIVSVIEGGIILSRTGRVATCAARTTSRRDSWPLNIAASDCCFSLSRHT